MPYAEYSCDLNLQEFSLLGVLGVMANSKPLNMLAITDASLVRSKSQKPPKRRNLPRMGS
jgi:hypothetical protein